MLRTRAEGPVSKICFVDVESSTNFVAAAGFDVVEFLQQLLSNPPEPLAQLLLLHAGLAAQYCRVGDGDVKQSLPPKDTNKLGRRRLPARFSPFFFSGPAVDRQSRPQ